jgi:NUMOD4 motif-containing protein
MSEIWKAVLDHEGLYEVSDMGMVRSLDRVVANGMGVERRLKCKAKVDTV